MRIRRLVFRLFFPLVSGLFFVFPSATHAQVFSGDLYLMPEDVRVEGGDAIIGQRVRLYATVHSGSDDDLTGVVRFYDELPEEYIGTDQPISVLAGRTDDVFVDWEPDRYGAHTIAVRVIPNRTAEDDPLNNKVALTVFADNDFDGDGIGNRNDSDDDNDGVPDSEDAFPYNAAESADADNDALGNNADPDDDNDGVRDAEDAFPLDPLEWRDTDQDGMGDNIDPDDDNDGLTDLLELEKGTDPLLFDTDGDGVNDALDAFPLDARYAGDADADGLPDGNDPDDDNDGVRDEEDAFPLDPAESADTDGDGIGDNADPDDDNDGLTDEQEAASRTHSRRADTDGDGVPDGRDAFPANRKESVDTDGDGVGNNADPDDDGDGVPDAEDEFPLNAEANRDTDEDGVSDDLDPDDDGDGVEDGRDLFPLDAAEWQDSDGDGLGDNADPNDLNKGPVARIETARLIVHPDDVVTFSALKSTDADGRILDYYWDFGDGTTDRGVVVDHVYRVTGEYPVRLTVTDDKGESRTAQISLTVRRAWVFWAFLLVTGLLVVLLAGLKFIFVPNEFHSDRIHGSILSHFKPAASGKKGLRGKRK